jgi:hypothetical protein
VGVGLGETPAVVVGGVVGGVVAEEVEAIFPPQATRVNVKATIHIQD